MKKYRIDILDRVREYEKSPEHVIMTNSRSYDGLMRLAYQKRGQFYPYLMFEEDYTPLNFHLLVKRNFPYLQQLDQAILRILENGFLSEGGYWIGDLKG